MAALLLMRCIHIMGCRASAPPPAGACTTLFVDTMQRLPFSRGCSGVLHSINATAPPDAVLDPLRLGMYRGPAPWWEYSHVPCNASACTGPFDARYQRIAALGTRQQFILDGVLGAICYSQGFTNVSGGKLVGCDNPGFGTDKDFRRWEQLVNGVVNEAKRRGLTRLECESRACNG